MKLRTLFLGASIAAGLAAGVLFMVSRQNVQLRRLSCEQFQALRLEEGERLPRRGHFGQTYLVSSWGKPFQE